MLPWPGYMEIDAWAAWWLLKQMSTWHMFFSNESFAIIMTCFRAEGVARSYQLCLGYIGRRELLYGEDHQIVSSRSFWCNLVSIYRQPLLRCSKTFTAYERSCLSDVSCSHKFSYSGYSRLVTRYWYWSRHRRRSSFLSTSRRWFPCSSSSVGGGRCTEGGSCKVAS